MAAVDTPICAARSTCGVIWISGRCSAEDEVTLSSSGIPRISATSMAAAWAAPSSVSPSTLTVRSFAPASFWKFSRTSGVSARKPFNCSSISNWVRSRLAVLP